MRLPGRISQVVKWLIISGLDLRQEAAVYCGAAEAKGGNKRTCSHCQVTLAPLARTRILDFPTSGALFRSPYSKDHSMLGNFLEPPPSWKPHTLPYKKGSRT